MRWWCWGAPSKIRNGETAEYCLKLSDSPPADADANDPWFVFISAHIDGEVYSDGVYKRDGVTIKWIPSKYRNFHAGDWNSCKDVRITAEFADDATVDEVAIKFTHHVWDHDNYCPPHLERSAPVTVTIGDRRQRRQRRE